MKIFTPQNLTHSAWNEGDYDTVNLSLSDIVGATKDEPALFIDERRHIIKCFNCHFDVLDDRNCISLDNGKLMLVEAFVKHVGDNWFDGDYTKDN